MWNELCLWSSDERFDCVIISRLTTKGINTSLVDWCMRTCQNPLHIKFRPKLKIRSRMILAQEFGNNLHHCGRLIFLFVCYQSSRDRNIRVGRSSGVVLKRLKLIRRAKWLLIFIILCANYISKANPITKVFLSEIGRAGELSPKKSSARKILS